MIQTINFRLADALPNSVLERWLAELSGKADAAVVAAIYQRSEKYLDAGHGECWLRNPAVAGMVEAALLHFDGERYRLLAWCVMPNHVHVLMETLEGFPLADMLHSWKSFSAKQANKILGRAGEFWQREYFDRYIRHAEHFQQAIVYIEENPVKAGLAKVKTEWPWSSARARAMRADTGSAGILPAS